MAGLYQKIGRIASRHVFILYLIDREELLVVYQTSS